MRSPTHAPAITNGPRTTRLPAALGLAAFAAALAATPIARAQWSAVVLHPTPPNIARSAALSVDAAQQAGTVFIDNKDHASLWTGSPGSWTDLTPAGATSSLAYAVRAGRQAGYSTIEGVQRAGLWSGSAVTWIDLHPTSAGAVHSAALGLAGSQQVGWAAIGGMNPKAGLWNGTAASWIELNPAGAISSIASRTDASQQVGHVIVTGVAHANLWTGSAASWIDLHPAGAAWSEAFAVDSGQQAGYARLAMGGVDHAALWSGSASSWIDLNPAGSLESRALGARAGRQVGYTDAGGFARRACLWTGSPASAVDLHAVLPPDYSRSQAHDIVASASRISVVGIAFNQSLGRNEAVLWTAPIDDPCPADFNHDGFVTGDDFDLYVAAFETGDESADFNHDGFVTGDDFDAFVAAFTEGC